LFGYDSRGLKRDFSWQKTGAGIYIHGFMYTYTWSK